MGDLTSVASSAIQALSFGSSVLGAFDSYQDKSGKREYEQTKAMQNLQLQQQRQNAAMEKERIRIDAEYAEKERQNALRRAMARQRAKYGANGIGSSGGSAQAVLLGLFDESEEELQQRTALDNLKTAGINQGVAQQQRINTLQLSQMKERNNLKRITSAFDALGSIF